MTAVEVSYHEATESVRIEEVPLSHLSIEVGHLYLKDFLEGDDKQLREQFERVGTWLDAAQRRFRARHGRQARISTCFLIDDYTPPADTGAQAVAPGEIAELVANTARAYGFKIDYLAREAGCAAAADVPYTEADDLVPLADIVAGLIVDEPEVGANGSRPPATVSGWLSNGARSPGKSTAMDSGVWQPPEEYGEWNHSVFMDIELWSTIGAAGREPRRVYSCAMLATVWHLLRLGLIRNEGRAVANTYSFPEGQNLPARWSELPTVIQLTRTAAPFAAYQTLSILPPHYRATEHAVSVILDHLQIDDTMLGQAVDRAAREKDPFDLPREPRRRMNHVFLSDV